MIVFPRCSLFLSVFFLSVSCCKADVCDDIGKILQEAARGYRNWKSEPLPKKTDEFGSTFILGGATRCKIELHQESVGSQFTCQWRFAKAAEAGPARDSIVNDVRNCRHVNGSDNQVTERPVVVKADTFEGIAHKSVRASFQVLPKAGKAFRISVSSDGPQDSSTPSWVNFRMYVDYDDVQ